MTNLISIDFTILAAYGTLSTVAYQSVKSAREGLKSFYYMIVGTTPYDEREKGIRGVCFGKDTLLNRVSHLSSSIQNFYVVGMCAFIGYLAFKKGMDLNTHHPIDANLRVNEVAWREQRQNFESIFQGVQKMSLYYKELEQFLTFGAKFNLPEDCFDLLKSVSPLTESDQRRLSECVSQLLFLVTYFEKYRQDPQMLTYLESRHFKAISAPSKEIENSKKALSILPTLPQEDSKEVKAAILGYTVELFDRFEADKRQVIDELYAPLYRNATLRLEDYVQQTMIVHWGPFTIHGDRICDSSEPSHRFIFNRCHEYHKRQQDLKIFELYQKEINSLNPSLYNTNAKDEVFEPALKALLSEYETLKSKSLDSAQFRAAIKKRWGLTPEFLEALIRFRKETRQD